VWLRFHLFIGHRSVKGSRLVRLFRPEFVIKYPRALCSEAYKYARRWSLPLRRVGGGVDSRSRVLNPWPPTPSPAKTTAAGEHEEQINEATTYLKTVRTHGHCAHGHTARA
jgi:hypothetical protein